jgi:hypothetical protein
MDSSVPTFLSTLATFWVFDSGRPHGYEVICQDGLDLYFSDGSNGQHLFVCAYQTFAISSFEEIVIQVLCLFF